MGVETAFIVGAVAAVASAAATGVAANNQAKAAKGAAKFQEKVAENNAILAERAAKKEEKRGRTEEVRQRLLVSGAIGDARVSAAARGVDVSQGSAQRIVEDIARSGEEDALTIRSNYKDQAASIRQQGANFSQQAELQRVAAQNANIERNNTLAATAINTGSNVAGRWYSYGGT